MHSIHPHEILPTDWPKVSPLHQQTSMARPPMVSGRSSDNKHPILHRRSPNALSPGSRSSSRCRMVGEYYLGKTLGKGVSGQVKLGIHKTTGENVAIKMISKAYLISHPTIEKAVRREIALMKLIQHPNVVALLDMIDDNDPVYLYLILEYVQGGDLFEHLVKKGRLSEKEARRYFQQMILGLDYCHRHLICHRDLKPENLILDGNNNIKIADFGMASLQPVGSMLETSCGSPHYASPEVFTGKPYHGAASDIWSCGIILYALLMGHLPFDDTDIRGLMRKVKSGKYEIPTSISRQARDLVSRILVVDPAKRATISFIMGHPWFMQSKLPLDCYPVPPSPRDIESPIRSPSEIDDRILETIQFLWSESTPDTVVHALLSEEPNMQKVIYVLLVQHAERYWEAEHDANEFHNGAGACHRHSQLSSKVGERARRCKTMAERGISERPTMSWTSSIKVPLSAVNKSMTVRTKAPSHGGGANHRPEPSTSSPMVKTTNLYDRIFRHGTISRRQSTKRGNTGEGTIRLAKPPFSKPSTSPMRSHQQPPPLPNATKPPTTTTPLSNNTCPPSSTVKKTAGLLATLSSRAKPQNKQHQAAMNIFAAAVPIPAQHADETQSRRSSGATVPSLVSDNSSTIETFDSPSNSTMLSSLVTTTANSNLRASWVHHLFSFKQPKVCKLSVYETMQSRVLPVLYDVFNKWAEVRLYEKSDRQGTRCKMEIKLVQGNGKVRHVKCRVDIVIPLHHDAGLYTRVQLTQQQGSALLLSWIVEQAQAMLDDQLRTKRKEVM